MRFAILGPVEVRTDALVLPIDRAQRRAVLAYLLLSANRVVSTTELIDALWDGAAPASAKEQIHNSMSAIRRVLRQAGSHHITSTPGGYRLTAADDEIDLLAFEQLMKLAQSTACSTPAQSLREALSLWRGLPLGGVSAAYVESARVRLEELRLLACEQLMELELGAGRHREAIPELTILVTANPLRERFVAQLMLALYRSDRPTEALTAYRRYRDLLAEEHGLDPGRQLQDLESAILRADPELDLPTSPPPEPQPDIFYGPDPRITQARALEVAGQLEEAARIYEKILDETLGTPAFLGAATVTMAVCAMSVELGQMHRAIEVGERSLAEFDRLGASDSEEVIRLLCTVAAAHCELDDHNQGERLLYEGLRRAERIGSERARASVHWNLSQIAAERGRYRDALDFGEQAVAYFRGTDDRRSKARILGAFGYILIRQEPPRAAEARDVLLEALEELAASGLGRGFDRSTILRLLSDAYRLTGEVEPAVQAARQSLADAGPDAAAQSARAHMALGCALAASDETDAAVDEFAAAARLLSQMHASRDAAKAWTELGEILAGTKDLTGALAAFRQANEELRAAQPMVNASSLEL